MKGYMIKKAEPWWRQGYIPWSSSIQSNSQALLVQAYKVNYFIDIIVQMIEGAMMLETAADISAYYPCKLGSHKMLKSTMIRRSMSAYKTRLGYRQDDVPGRQDTPSMFTN